MSIYTRSPRRFSNACYEARPIRLGGTERGRSFWRVLQCRTHPQGVVPSCCNVWPHGFGVVVESGRSWGVSDKHSCDSRVFGRQQWQCSNAQSGWLCGEAGSITSQTTARSRLTWIDSTTPSGDRRVDSTTKQEGDRVSSSGAETGLARRYFQTSTETGWNILFFRDGREGKPTGRGWKPEHVRGSGGRLG